MAEAKFYRSLHGRNKGLFYRGAKRPGAGGGSNLGALGRGLYLTWDRNMAQFFADRNRGQVYTYKIPGNLKLLDAQSQEMADIKATMGFKPWEYSDSSMYAAIVTNEAKALGYDGVISEKVADGLVLFEPRKAKLVTEASASKVTARYLIADCDVRGISHSWIDPKGKVHLAPRGHENWARDKIQSSPSLERQFEKAHAQWVEAGMAAYLKPWARGFLIDQGWVRVANFLNFQVRDSTNVSRHALDSAVDLIIDCVVKTGIDPETTVVRVSDRDVRLLHKVSVSEIVREWGGRKAEDRLFDALMARIASRVAARYQDEGFVGDRWGSRGSGILFTHEDRMLLLKRSGAVLEPGTWGIPGGAIGIDGDGNYEDAWKSALREASEEAGGVRGSPKGKFVFRDGSFTYTTFFVEAAKEFAPRLNWESSDWAWVTREEALGMRLHPGVRKLMKSRAASGRDRDLELHLYDFDGTLFRSPLRPDWWGKRSWWVESESLGPPCVPLKPGSGWWIGSTVRAAKKSIADPNVWAILCTGRADTGSLRYRVAELLKQQGLGFDEVYLAKGGQDAPSMYKVNVMAKILSRYPNIATVQIWEDTNLSRYVRYIESTGRTCIPHPVKVAPHEVDCTEEDMARMVEEGWSKWRKQP